jgi:DNA replication protein DnaC
MSTITGNIEQMLRYLDLNTMANALDGIVRSPKVQDLDTMEIIHEMVAAEFDERNARNTKALLRLARLAAAQADIEKTDFHPKRELNQNFIRQLSSCEYIADRKNVYILGYSGSGKSFFAQALGVEACRNQYRTKYLPDSQAFLEEMEHLKVTDMLMSMTFLGGGADKKLDFSMILDQDSCDTQEGFSLPRTF